MEDPINRAELDRIIAWVKAEARRLRGHGKSAYGLALTRASERFNVNRTQLARHSQKRGLAVRRKRSKQRKIAAEMPRPKPKDIQMSLGFEDKLNRSLGIDVT